MVCPRKLHHVLNVENLMKDYRLKVIVYYRLKISYNLGRYISPNIIFNLGNFNAFHKKALKVNSTFRPRSRRWRVDDW